MAEPIPTPPGKMTREEFRRWVEAQPRGRYELAAGEVVAMAPERAAHNDTKLLTWLACGGRSPRRDCHAARWATA